MVYIGELIAEDVAGFACSKAKLASDGLLHLRPFNISPTGQLDLSDRYLVPYDEAPKDKRRLEAGDILFNNTNSVEWVGKSALIREPTDAGFSNHMTRVRVDRSKVLPEWFAYWLGRKQAVGFFAANATQWVSQAAYRIGDLKKLEVYLPTIAEQQRIVDILDRASGIQRLRREADDKMREMVPALFVDMFGDPTTNPMGFEVVSLGSICNLVRGSSPRPQGDKRYFGGSIPRLMIADITRDGVYVTPKIDSLTELGATKSRPMIRGEVVMAVSGAVGLPAILDVDACIHDGFVGFRALSKNVLTEYLYWFIRSQRKLASSQAVGATFQNLTTDQIRQWKLPVPEIELQQEFAARANSVASQARWASKASLVVHDTIASLNRVFFGP